MPTLKVVTYNLRFANEDDAQPWSVRRRPMVELVSELAPDILGTQEGLDHQLDDLMRGLGNQYELVSQHRCDDGPEENSAIIYNAHTVELTAIEHQWFSDTPDIPGSISWGNSLPRLYSQATFRRVADGMQLYVISTHFDHVPGNAQLKSAHQLVRRIAELDPERPLIVMGDFNAGEESEPYSVLTCSGLRDVFLTATNCWPRLGTFNDYGQPDPNGARIDWILTNSYIQTDMARIVDSAPAGQYPSDHLPVEAIVTL